MAKMRLIATEEPILVRIQPITHKFFNFSVKQRGWILREMVEGSNSPEI